MTAPPRRRRCLPLGLATAAAALTLAGPALAADPEVVATGLDNPRGLGFGPWGLYVAESGTGGEGPCLAGPEAGEVCYGETGAVTVIGHHGQQRIVEGLPSLAAPGGAEAVGASDVSFAKDGHHGYDERGFLTVGLAANPADRAQFGEGGAGLAQLWRLHADGYSHPVADLGQYEADNNPDAEIVADAEVPDTNPNSVAAVDGRHAYVADAGGNDVLYVHKRTGKIDLVGVLPGGEAPAPPIPDFPVPPGTPIPYQPVPTSVAVGHDGEVYVGQLTGFPFPEGQAGVWVIRPGEDPVPYATGFTHITGLAVGRDGSIYVVQLQDTSLLAGPGPGSVIRIRPDGTKETVAADLTAPYDIALKHGWAYVTTHATEAGTGEVVRFPVGDDDDHDGHDHDSDD